MGSGSSKMSFLSNKKKGPEKHCPNFKRLQELKQEDIMHLHDGCVSPHFGKSGLAFYAPMDDNDPSGEKKRNGFENKPTLSSERHLDVSLSTSLRSAEERELLADVKKEEKLQEKALKAKMVEEKRLLVLQRREKKEKEIKEKYEAKIKKMEERKQELQNRLRPPNSKVRSFHSGDTENMNSKNLSLLEL